MGIQSLHEYIDSLGLHYTPLNNVIESDIAEKTSNLIVVHAESCLRYFYQEHVDWVCGGQWSELFNYVERFVRAFHQADIELVVFFDGILNEISLRKWSSKHQSVRETAKETLSHITHNESYPSKTIIKQFVPPGALKSALRHAFRTCEVLVCSSLSDTYKESILYSKDVNALGILGYDANYIIYNSTNYSSLGNIKWIKKTLNLCKVYNLDNLLSHFEINEDHLPSLAALIGNYLISDNNLSAFFWDLVDDESPLKKIQSNIPVESVLPPSEVRLKNVIKFLKENSNILGDFKALSEIVFVNSKTVTVEEGAEKLETVVTFYKDCLLASKSAQVVLSEDSQFTKSGFPLPTKEHTGTNRFKNLWHTKADKENGSLSNDEVNNVAVEDAENVLKKGTLEEAAQALEQLELKETQQDENNKENVCEEKPRVKIETSLPQYPREINIKPLNEKINTEVFNVARKRHQTGQMCAEILQLLSNAEIVLDMSLDDETTTSRQPIPLIYRPLRQLVYGVLFEVKQTEGETKAGDNEDVQVKEYAVYGEREDLMKPDLVQPLGMSWGTPPLRKLWLGTEPEDNTNRLKAFLSCMKSDTINMANTSMVPQRLMILCCVIRYLVQQEVAVLTKQDIDAFLAQALSTHLTTDHSVQNLANIKLNRIDARCVQLGAIFMKGVENAIIANDACGSPVPWEFCSPWNYFDGKLFHHKWLQSSLNPSTLDLCEGKAHLAEKLERLRWCITEGLHDKYNIVGLNKTENPFTQFSNNNPSYGPNPSGFVQHRMRSRGAASKRPVLGNGGTLHVAGFPVAHWDGNKSGIGYSKHGPKVLVGGPNSVVLPSNQRRGGARISRGGARMNNGPGLLETPFITPWHQQGYHQHPPPPPPHQMMKGVQKKHNNNTHHHQRVYSSRTRHQPDRYKRELWFGKGRGNDASSPVAGGNNRPFPRLQPKFSRGQWLSEGTAAASE